MIKYSKRCTYVDIAKGIAILAVVLMHVKFSFTKYILVDTHALFGYYWHVPVFFLIGGFFLKDEKLLTPVSFIKGKMQSLYRLALYLYLPITLLHNVFFNLGWYSTAENYGGKVMTLWGVKEYAIGIIKTFLCMGQEPLAGAMWFVYALLFALCGYSIIVCIISRIKLGGYIPLILLGLQIASCISTNVFAFTIPRVSNAISAMLLLYIGQQINRNWEIEFNNKYVFIGALMIVYESSLLVGGVSMNSNQFVDVLQLTAGSVCALYAICFISKKLEGKYIGHILEVCGKESFYIMGLHFIGFRICSEILLRLGIINGGLAYLTTPPLGHNIGLLILYTLWGMAFPVVAIKGFRMAKKYTVSVFDRK